MSKHGELKRAAIQRKNELEHFGIPGMFQIDPDVFLSILAELEVSNNVGRALGDTIGSVCDSRDALVRVNEQLKAENARSTEREILQLAEIEALRNALRPLLANWDDLRPGESLNVDAARAALGEGEQP